MLHNQMQQRKKGRPSLEEGKQRNSIPFNNRLLLQHTLQQPPAPAAYPSTTACSCSIPFNNRLLLQLHLLRDDFKYPLTRTQNVFDDLCSHADFPIQTLGHLTQTCLNQLKYVEDIDTFLDTKLEKLEWFGDYSKQHSISRNFLLSISPNQPSVPSNAPTLSFIHNGLLLDMNTFRNRKRLTAQALLLWLQTLCADFINMTVDQLKDLIARILKRVTRMQKRKGDAGGASKLQDFRDQSCLACK